MNPDLIDALVGIDSRVGEPTPEWPYSDDFAVKRMTLGASLTILRDQSGKVLRYTLHHIGAPFVISTELGKRLQSELTLRQCWVTDHLGAYQLDGGTLTLYQADDSPGEQGA